MEEDGEEDATEQRERVIPRCRRRRAQIEVGGAKNGQQSKLGFAKWGRGVGMRTRRGKLGSFLFQFSVFCKR